MKLELINVEKCTYVNEAFGITDEEALEIKKIVVRSCETKRTWAGVCEETTRDMDDINKIAYAMFEVGKLNGMLDHTRGGFE